ncbi:MAG: ROK family transcriptional regulator [Terriglobia bacterium]
MPSNNTNSKVDQKDLLVLQLIHANPNVSRKELATGSGFSAASITAIVQRLIDHGLVTELGESRRPVSLGIRNDLAYVVGVDVGSFLLRVIVADVLGNVVYSRQTETQMSNGREHVLSRTFNAIRNAMNESGVAKGSVKGIGMAHSGVIDTQNGVVLSFPRPGQMAEWKNVRLKDMLEAEFSLPSVLDDSARMMAIAEKHFGLGTDLSDFLYIGVGMGIGAAIFIDGKLYRGPGGGAGEFGHMTVDEKGPLCSCGNNGCLEAVASCTAIIAAVRSAIQQGVNSRVSELAQGDLERISVEVIIQAAQENDTLAFRVLHEAISHIGVALSDVVNLLNPNVVIFGGPLFRESRQLLLEPLKRVIRQCALEKSANELELKVSSLGSEAGALGAVRLISEKVLDVLYQEKAG